MSKRRNKLTALLLAIVYLADLLLLGGAHSHGPHSPHRCSTASHSHNHATSASSHCEHHHHARHHHASSKRYNDRRCSEQDESPAECGVSLLCSLGAAHDCIACRFLSQPPGVQQTLICERGWTVVPLNTFVSEAAPLGAPQLAYSSRAPPPAFYLLAG